MATTQSINTQPADRSYTPLTPHRGCAERVSACLQQIKQWACTFFQWLFCCSRTEPKPISSVKTLNTTTSENIAGQQVVEPSMQLGTQPKSITPVNALKPTALEEPVRQLSIDVRHLVQDFQNKKKTHNSSGYHVHVHLEKNSTLNADRFPIEIVPRGIKNQSIVMPRAAEESAKNFAVTRKQAIPLCEEITKHIAKFHMYAIFSNSANLLLIPDTQQGINAADYPHFFALNQAQLDDVFSATLVANAYLQSRYSLSGYKPHVRAHVGIDGNQTEGLLHMRFERLPRQIKFQALEFIKSLVLTGVVQTTSPPRYEFEVTFKDNTTYCGSLSLKEISYYQQKIPDKIQLPKEIKDLLNK